MHVVGFHGKSPLQLMDHGRGLLTIFQKHGDLRNALLQFQHLLSRSDRHKGILFFRGLHFRSEHAYNTKGPRSDLLVHILRHENDLVPQPALEVIEQRLSDKDALLVSRFKITPLGHRVPDE